MKNKLVLLSLLLASSCSYASPALYFLLSDNTKSISYLFGYRLGYYIYKDQIISKKELGNGEEFLKINPHDEKKVEGIDNYSVILDNEKKIKGIYGTTYFSNPDTCLANLNNLKQAIDRSYAGIIQPAVSNPQFLSQYVIESNTEKERMAFGCTQPVNNKYKLFVSSFVYDNNIKEQPVKNHDRETKENDQRPTFSDSAPSENSEKSLNSYSIL